ncbi:2-(3-amino-3-carboxypropyl)histidine synthase subunit 2-like [Coffea eugenioides]|uniref:2-(3-amino-3-carboxypropyl)histidine synthase subunit 2-like n=1 Tax=Coffea eugenioides TaxID=49369 RepID=UPI000F60BD3E|nr:2-(3-amino-3-carboxypropyl)histidine synthase subunit 2-like [Coffea eugenioides]
MDFENYYEISLVADFINAHNFSRVALQFPDELLKDSRKVVSALWQELHRLLKNSDESRATAKLYVMANTTYGGCCVDEVGAAHVKADCVIHYGHSCLSPTTTIPAFCVFGKAPLKASNCAESLYNYGVKSGKPVLVLFGLEYAHGMPDIKEALNVEATRFHDSNSGFQIHFANVTNSVITPSTSMKLENRHLMLNGEQDNNEDSSQKADTKFRLGGLGWSLPEGHRMEDYLLFWIGLDNSAFTNFILTFNSCEIVRYDAIEGCLKTDVSQQAKILKRRYYLVEKAKDANMVGILVGTLGVAGYLDMIHQMTELVTRAGKKAYTFLMGKPNPAKLANFPECDVFIYVSCAQTALLDSKEFLAPIITPFEALIAFNRGSQWTGAYSMEFQDVVASQPAEVEDEAGSRFSFFQGGYVEDFKLQEGKEEKDAVLSLVNVTEKALLLQNKDSELLSRRDAKSGAEFFAARSYQGLEIHSSDSFPELFLIGRAGKTSGYEDEQSK